MASQTAPGPTVWLKRIDDDIHEIIPMGTGQFTEEPTSSPVLEGQLVFHGYDGIECERFLQAVRQHIFYQGRQYDDAYITSYVAACLTEDALRWHISLDDATRDSWRSLERAMIAAYPPPPRRASVYGAKFIPESPSARPRARSGRLGRILVSIVNSHIVLYIAKTMNANGIFYATDVAEDALTLAYVPSDQPQDIAILNSKPYSARLGVTWHQRAPSFLYGAVEWAAVTGNVGDGPGGDWSYNSTGPSASAIWIISPSGAMKAQWTGWNGRASVKKELFMRVNNQSKEVFLVADDVSHVDSTFYQKASFSFDFD